MLGPDGRPPPIRSGLRTPHVACKGCPPLEQLFEQFADGGGELVSCDAEEPCDRRAAGGVVLVAMLERSRKVSATTSRTRSGSRVRRATLCDDRLHMPLVEDAKLCRAPVPRTRRSVSRAGVNPEMSTS